MIKYVLISAYHLACMFCVAQEPKYWNLKECVEHAIENNIAIQRQQIEVKIKNSEMLIAKNERLPAVNGYSNLYSVFGRSQDIFGNIQRNDNLNSNMGVTAEIMLYNFRALRNRAQKGKIGQEIAEFEIDVMQRELTIKVVQAYVDLLLKQSVRQTRDSAAANAYSLYERTKSTTEAGRTSQSELYEAKATYARALQEQAVSTLGMESAKLALAQLMLLDNHTQLFIAADLAINAFQLPEIFSEQDSYVASYKIHPSLKKMSRRIDEIEIERKIVKAERYPFIRGSATLGSTYFNLFASQQVLPFFMQTGNNFAQQIAITANIPIFNRGHTRLRLRQLDLSGAGLKLDEQRQKQEIRQEIQQILFDFRSNQQQYANAQEIVELAEKAMDFAKKSYEAGRSSIYDYNNSRNNFIQAQNAVLEARYSTIFSYKMLLYQTTGSYDDE